MALFHTYNNEDILSRAVLAGILDILNNKIKYKQAWSDDDVETIEVPWYYNQSGDERFMQDFFTHYKHCVAPKPVDGNYDMVPRGSITYTGSSIDEQRITSRFVQGTYVKDTGDGKLEQYVSFLYSIPLTVRIDCEMWIDTQVTALKIEQEIREVFFKNVTFYVYYKGMRVGCTAGFPADTTMEKNIQYSFESDNRIKLTFQVEIESYQPVFDPTTEQLANNKMTGFAWNLYNIDQRTEDIITITAPTTGAVLPKGYPVWFEWIFNNEGAVLPKIDVYWLDVSTNVRNDIVKNEINHEFYIWNIPEDFTTYRQPTIIWNETDTLTIIRPPVLSIIPNLTTSEITASSFDIIETGYFGTTGLVDASINISLEIKDSSGNITYTDDGEIWVNIKYNQIDTVNPIVIDSSGIFYTERIDYKEIDIQISSTTDTDAFGVLNNIKIV
jgi:hypothetical protein